MSRDTQDFGPSLMASAPKPVSATPRLRRSPVLLELALVVFLVWIYNWVQDVVPLRRQQALANARVILTFEAHIGLDPERALDHWLAHQDLLGFMAANFYAVAIFAVTFGFAATTWWRRPDLYVDLRNELVLANVIAFAVFWAFPVAPPRMLPGFVDVVAGSGTLGWHNTLVRHADQLAAMPSMHLGYAVWCSLVAWRLATSKTGKKWAAVFGIGYPLLTAVVVLATGNHYLMDVLAGAATVAVAVVAVEVVPEIAQRQVSRPRFIYSPPRPSVALVKSQGVPTEDNLLLRKWGPTPRPQPSGAAPDIASSSRVAEGADAPGATRAVCASER